MKLKDDGKDYLDRSTTAASKQKKSPNYRRSSTTLLSMSNTVKPKIHTAVSSKEYFQGDKGSYLSQNISLYVSSHHRHFLDIA